MNNYLSYVAIDLTDESKQMLFNLISQTIQEKDYFQSLDPGYAYINGNVAKKGHLTLCYGIKNLDMKKKFEEAKLKLDWQHYAVIKDIQINLGYQGKYYVIVAIPEVDKNIFSLDTWIRNSNEIIADSSPFDPHLALCYIKNQGNYPSEIFKNIQEKLIGKTVEFDSLNFYLPNGQEKITLVKF